MQDFTKLEIISYQCFVMSIDEGLLVMDYATYVPNTQGQLGVGTR